MWELITNIILVLSILTLAAFVVLGIYQWVKRGSIKKVDQQILWIPLPMVLMTIVYFLFDKVWILNTRPIDPSVPSFPSSHVMVVATIFFIASMLLPKYIKSFMSLKVEDYIDLDTHGMFICSVTEARVISDKETMSYTYYQNNVKPKPETEGKKGWVCKICGYIYEGDELPEDFICPLCKHGVADFEPIEG